MYQKPTLSSTEGAGETNRADFHSIPTKHELCIYELLKAGMTGIHKIGAPQQAFGETCLPTTISELGLKRGLIIYRERRKHTHRAGGKTYFTWYRLSDQAEAEKALKILNQLRAKRKASAICEQEADKLLYKFPKSALPTV